MTTDGFYDWPLLISCTKIVCHARQSFLEHCKCYSSMYHVNSRWVVRSYATDRQKAFIRSISVCSHGIASVALPRWTTAILINTRHAMRLLPLVLIALLIKITNLKPHKLKPLWPLNTCFLLNFPIFHKTSFFDYNHDGRHAWSLPDILLTWIFYTATSISH